MCVCVCVCGGGGGGGGIKKTLVVYALAYEHVCISMYVRVGVCEVC